MQIVMSGIGMARYIIFLVLLMGLAGCMPATPAVETLIPEVTPTLTAVPVAIDDENVPEQDGPVTLRIWVPPQFNPANDSPEGAVFQSR